MNKAVSLVAPRTGSKDREPEPSAYGLTSPLLKKDSYATISTVLQRREQSNSATDNT